MLKGSIGMTGDFIKIANLKVFAHHGVFPEETRDGQDFYVNAKLFLVPKNFQNVPVQKKW